ncbi:hypothetical protein IGK38_003071 [Enterococcus pernyi]
MTNTKMGFFSNKDKPDTSYKKIPTPKSSFNADNEELLEHVQEEEDVLKINSKSLGIPASVWCEFMALLDTTTENDYTYELLEELIHEKTARFTHEQQVSYTRSLERKKEQERERIIKKQMKRRK